MMNSAFMLDCAQDLAARVTQRFEDDTERMEFTYETLFGRHPKPSELELGLSFLSMHSPSSETDGVSKEAAGYPTRWRKYVQVLLSSNEFLFMQ